MESRTLLRHILPCICFRTVSLNLTQFKLVHAEEMGRKWSTSMGRGGNRGITLKEPGHDKEFPIIYSMKELGTPSEIPSIYSIKELGTSSRIPRSFVEGKLPNEYLWWEGYPYSPYTVPPICPSCCCLFPPYSGKFPLYSAISCHSLPYAHI